MAEKLKKVIIFLIIIFIFNANTSKAETYNENIIKDINLQTAISKHYNFDGIITIAKASELSAIDDALIVDNAKISDLEGLQYFDKLVTVYFRKNSLYNLQPLSEIGELRYLEISDNSIKGQNFMNAVKNMGKIEKLKSVSFNGDGLTNINFLKKIGDIHNYSLLSFENNKISDITVLKKAINLEDLYLSNNRVTDVTPLKDLDKLSSFIDLRDNCIIDYKPIKPLLDKMYEEIDDECGVDRYDYYTNPVNFKFGAMIIKFPYLTVYYQYQAYAEAIPLFKAFGGSAEYDKKTGILTCKYNGNVLIMKDFSKSYTLNGEKKYLKYEMRRMQYDLAYVPVKDICNVLGLKYTVIKKRRLYIGEDKYKYAPKEVVISND